MSFKDFRPIVISITPSGTAYSANGVVGGLLTPTLTTVPTVITGISVSIGQASIAVPGTLYFYKSSPTTTFADGDAFAPVAADNDALIAAITLPTALSLNSRNVYHMRYGTGGTMPLLEISSQFYIYYVTSGTPNFNAAQTIKISLFQLGGR